MLAALCWGISGGIGAILMAEGWDAFVVSFYRGAIGFLFVLVWLAFRPRSSGLSNPSLWFWSVLSGLGIASNFTFYFVSISEGSVAVAATLMYCAPVFVYFVSFALKLERFTAPKAAAIALVMLGIVLLTRIYDIESDDVTLIGLVAGLLAGVSYAIFIFGFKYAVVYGSPQSILVIAFATLVVVLIGLSNKAQMILVMSTPDWPLFLVLGVLGSGVSFIIYFIGLKRTSVTTASVVAMVEPVTAALFGILVLNETLISSQIVGIALIMITVTALSIYSRTRHTPYG
ncbi:DMT family transporter [Hydrogenovibrio sp. 3SP14C1]|uniref:DMT family transporter n=1 Tax=Hydrogenovibrio sp. 3SP14C1 TaxID=3038774 RepID=UPI00241766A2|nr:DMT family transporter [Hydrogenovibrio sp. 3SP14C1]MDG4812784.1 DMT family transporter [Hydrogenovibrio sp. 3SP14C1]